MAEKDKNNMQSEADIQTNRQESKHKFVFSKCCCCVPLRIGCLVLAYLHLVGSIVNLVLTSITVFTFSHFLITRYSEGLQSILVPLLAYNVVTLATSLLLILPTAILLLIGLHKNKAQFVKIFVIVLLIVLILNIIRICVSFSMLGIHWLSLVMDTVMAVFDVYCLLVMRSQYVKMRESIINLPPQLYRDGRAVLTTLKNQAEP